MRVQGLALSVARLLQGGAIRSELKDVHFVWSNEGRMARLQSVQKDCGATFDYRAESPESRIYR
jgi:hypothetical protein